MGADGSWITEFPYTVAIADPRHTVKCQNMSRSVYSVALCWRKPQIFAFFGLWHLVVSPAGSSLRKFNTGAQLQTFPYPMASKSFLYSNAFTAKSGTQTLTFKSVTDRQTKKQTDKQTDRQKTQRFWPPRRQVKSEPHQTWHSDRGPRARSCRSLKLLGSDTVSPLGGAQNLGITRPFQLKTPITP